MYLRVLGTKYTDGQWGPSNPPGQVHAIPHRRAQIHMAVPFPYVSPVCSHLVGQVGELSPEGIQHRHCCIESHSKVDSDPSNSIVTNWSSQRD